MNAPAFTGGRWYAKRGVSQMVSMDTTIWSAPSQNTDGSRWFVFADADEHGENEATANLIAAAPELFARLEQVLPYLNKMAADGVNTCKPVQMMIDQVETALAHARGEVQS